MNTKKTAAAGLEPPSRSITPPVALYALRLTPLSGQKLTPAQQRFQKLLTQVDKLKNQLTELNTLTDAHRRVYHQKIGPIKEKTRLVSCQIVQLLVQRLEAKTIQNKPLTKIERATATEILCHLTESLAADGDAEMAALHDVYSQQTLEDKQRQVVQEMRVAMEEMLGGPLYDEDDPPVESVEDLMRAGQQRMRQVLEEAHAEQAQAQAARKPTARQRKAQSEQEDADAILRKVFRQLASALHPDREIDPVEQVRKTALMSEANAAYQKRDLVALLQIQLRTELTDAASVAQMAEEKINSLSLLLKEQIAELNDELKIREHVVSDEFGFDLIGKINAVRLRSELAYEALELQQRLHWMKTNLHAVQDEGRFKAWLKEQRKLM